LSVRIASLAALLGAALLGGCSSGNSEFDAAIEENTALRARIATLQSALDECDTNRAAAEAENAQLAEGLDALRGGSADGTGFENIPGATVSRGAGGSVVVAVAGDVLFDSGKAELKSTARQSLDRIAQVIQSQYAGQTVRVEGYTDSDPIRRSTWRSNEHLSAERALAVEQHLVSRGITNDRIYSAAFGPANPRSTKDQSRRVEIVVLASGA
jgi:chemotaxis protein MotB